MSSKRKPKKRTIRHQVLWLGALFVSVFSALFVLLLIFSGEIYDYQDTIDGVNLPSVDAIVCLAGGRGRITAAGDLWYQYFDQAQGGQATSATSIPVLYLSGTGARVSWKDLSRHFRRGVLRKLRPREVIIERESSNTYANAVWFSSYAKKKGWKRIILLTSSYHMRRSQLIFQQVIREKEIPLEVETYSIYQEPFSSAEWRSALIGIQVTFTEYFKLLFYQSMLFTKRSGA